MAEFYGILTISSNVNLAYRIGRWDGWNNMGWVGGGKNSQLRHPWSIHVDTQWPMQH